MAGRKVDRTYPITIAAPVGATGRKPNGIVPTRSPIAPAPHCSIPGCRMRFGEAVG